MVENLHGKTGVTLDFSESDRGRYNRFVSVAQPSISRGDLLMFMTIYCEL